MTRKKTGLTLMILIALGGCTSSQVEKTKVPLENDPRIKENVKQVCFVKNIRGWNTVDNDRNAVIVTMSNKEKYKLKVVGSCDPDLAIMHLAVIPRVGSGCFGRGDKLKTDGDLSKGFGSGCTIMAVNRWDPEALDKAENKPASSSDKEDN